MLIYQKLSGTWNKAKRLYEFPKGQPRLLYKGRFAFAFGGGGSSQEVVATGPWQEQAPYVNMLFDQAQQLYRQGAPSYYGGQLTPNINPTLQSSWDSAAGIVGQNNAINSGVQTSLLNTASQAGNNPINQVAGGVAPNVAGGINTLIQGQNSPYTVGQNLQNPMQQNIWQSLAGQNATQQTAQQLQPGFTGGVNQLLSGTNAAAQAGQQLNPFMTQAIQNAGGPAPMTQFGQVDASGALNTALNSNGMNPYTGQIVDAALRSSNEQFSSNIIPQIRSQAGQANQTGGTRQGIAEGIAARGLANQQGDIISKLYGQAFDVGSADRNAALGLVAQGQGANQQAGLTQQGLGLQGAQISAGLTQSGADLANRGLTAGTQAAGNLLTTGTGQGLQASQQAGNLLTQGADLSQQSRSTGTAQGSNLIQAGNNAALDQYYRSLGLLPQIQANQLGQVGFQNQTGLQQYGIGQQNIDANMERYFYNQLAPYNALTQFQNYISGPYGSSLPGQTTQSYVPPNYTRGQRPPANRP